MHCTIRPALETDLPLVLNFIRELAEYEHLADQVVATEDRLKATLFPESGRPAAEAVLAFAGERPAGFAVFFTTFSTFLAKPGLWLEDLYVKPEHRKSGIGKALWQYGADEARRRGCGRYEWNVLDWNEPAIRFYERQGATIMKEWKLCRLLID